MRTFATLAVLAAAVSAECWETMADNGITNKFCDGEYDKCNEDCWMTYNEETQEQHEVCQTWCHEVDPPLEQFLDDVGDALENIADAVMDPEEALEELAHGVEEVMEDLECWWAERAPETTCAKRERMQAAVDCGMIGDGQWNWEEQYCMNEEQAREWNIRQCQDDDACTAEWIENEWNPYCQWDCSARDQLNLRTDLKISSNKPMLAFLERSAAGSVQKRSALRHILSVNSPISVDLDLEKLARPAVAAAEDYCMTEVDDNGKVVNHSPQQKEQGARKDRKARFSKSNVRQHHVRADRPSRRPRHAPAQKKQQRKSANTQVSVDLDLEELARLQQDAEIANMEVEETLTYFADDLANIIDAWAPHLQQMAEEKKRQDEQFAQDLAELIGSSITIDGTSLGEIVEQMMNGEDEHMDEADWLMARRVAGARDVRSMFALDTVTPADAGMVGQFEEDFQPTNLNVEISVDSVRMNELIEQAMWTFSDAKDEVEDSLNYFLGEVNDLASELDEEFEFIEDNVMETVDEVGDFVKSTLMDEEATQVEFSLAQKKPKAKKQQQSTNYAKAAAGATFGAIALFSIVGLIANQKKSVREHEESLL